MVDQTIYPYERMGSSHGTIQLNEELQSVVKRGRVW